MALVSLSLSLVQINLSLPHPGKKKKFRDVLVFRQETTAGGTTKENTYLSSKQILSVKESLGKDSVLKVLMFRSTSHIYIYIIYLY